MKLKLLLDVAPRVYPFSYPQSLSRQVYDRMPSYERHDRLSIHSVGWVQAPVDATRRGLVFSEPAHLGIGMAHEAPLREFLESLEEDPELIGGMTVTDVQPIQPPGGGEVRYWAESPVLVRDGDRHVRYDADDAPKHLTRTARQKLDAAGLPEAIAEQVSVRFDNRYEKSKTKVVSTGTAEFMGNFCPVLIDAPAPLVHETLMSTGIGGLTGMGFGAITPRPASIPD
jgi:hypothetical protein